MNTQASPSTSSSTAKEIAHLSPALITRISRAYSDSDSALARRVLVIRAARAAGFTVKAIAADMRAAAAFDPSITAVSSTVYGFANAASEAVDLARVPSISDVNTDDLATLARAAQHVKVGPFKSAMRTVAASMSDDATSADRFAAIMDAARVALDTVRADRAPKTREAHSQGGMRDDAADTADTADTVTAPADVSPELAMLAGIHRATAYLQGGGEWSENLASALAALTDAATKARKRTRVAA